MECFSLVEVRDEGGPDSSRTTPCEYRKRLRRIANAEVFAQFIKGCQLRQPRCVALARKPIVEKQPPARLQPSRSRQRAFDARARIHKVSATREAWRLEEEEGLDLWGNLAGEWQ